MVHADVKLENCIFGSTDSLDSLKLVDFGLSLNIKLLSQMPQGHRGTYIYMAPEILTVDPNRPVMLQLSDRTDVWAAGVILYSLVIGEYPFTGASTDDII